MSDTIRSITPPRVVWVVSAESLDGDLSIVAFEWEADAREHVRSMADIDSDYCLNVEISELELIP